MIDSDLWASVLHDELRPLGIILLNVFGSEEASDCSFRNVRTFAAPDVIVKVLSQRLFCSHISSS